MAIPPSSDGNIQINPFQLLMGDPTIVFSAVGTVQDMRELVDLAARGVVRTHVSRTGSLSELDTIFDELAGARVPRPRRHHRPHPVAAVAAGRRQIHVTKYPRAYRFSAAG